MKASRFALLLATCLASVTAVAQQPAVGAPLPTLTVEDRGEIVIDGDDFDFVPWRSDNGPAKVHVIQYFGATLSQRDIFAPFTDRLQTAFEPGTVHVTTVLNLDAAMWGTRGMVVSELKKNKSQHPEATIVADEDGRGVSIWELGKKGAALMILDAAGVVRFFSPGALKDDELGPAIELIRSNLGG